ncbi:MAG TPA: hypothetical protein PK509_04710 [Catalimonadaceae bacterium]|nr:hypothetical protein [Catalimonadaceae bacterium]HPI09405.1 hypothetical protein [Catalimonadaceae bacterium]
MASQRAILILLLFFGIPAIPSLGKNENDPENGKEVSQGSNASEIRQLIARVMEIKGMDRSILEPEERELLKSELRLIKTDLQESSRAQKTNKLGGVYISVGGIIIILLILLIIL